MEWKMVPKVMTDEMTRAAQAALDLGEGYVETSCLDLDAAYEAAIAAAPDAPGEPVDAAKTAEMSDLVRDIRHYIECADNGLCTVPRMLLTHTLSALATEGK